MRNFWYANSKEEAEEATHRQEEELSRGQEEFTRRGGEMSMEELLEKYDLRLERGTRDGEIRAVWVPKEQEELDAIERPASQAQVEEDIYECEHCNAEFRESEILQRDFGGETGGITFCPRCKQETKLIVTEVEQ